MMLSLHKAINRGIRFIQTQQLPEGGFLSYSSPHAEDFKKELTYHTTFATSLILNSLCHIPSNNISNAIKKRATNYLLTQKSNVWSFNYWDRHSREFSTLPYPDDLDDTATALASLSQVHPSLVDGEVLAHVVHLLTRTEDKVGGPYRTWLVRSSSAKTWLDIDPAVNANIAYFLSLHGIFLSPLESYLTSLPLTNLASRYYYGPEPLYYFLARATKDSIPDLRDIIIQRLAHEKTESILKLALMTSSLLQMGYPDVQNDIKSLLLAQQSDGSWNAEAFCLDPAKNDRPYYSGSEALTTALCCEALALYQAATAPRKQLKAVKIDPFHDRVMLKVDTRLKELAPPIQEKLRAALNAITTHDKNQTITNLPLLFSHSLSQKPPPKMLPDLGYATLFGWTAYSLFDSVLDQEPDADHRIPMAALAHREAVTTFLTTLRPYPTFFSLFKTLYDRVDQANAWEKEACWFNPHLPYGEQVAPSFTDMTTIAERSIGFCLGPLIVLAAAGHRPTSKAVTQTILFFRHYLTARQMHDDMHDWEDDLKHGHWTPVLARLLSKQTKTKKKTPLSDVLNLKEYFWRETITEVCAIITNHTNKARRALKTNSALHDTLNLELLLVPLEKGAQSALSHQQETLRFLETYTKNQITHK